MSFTEEEKKDICKLFRKYTLEEVSTMKNISMNELVPLKEEYDSTVNPLDLEYREFNIAIRDGYSLEDLQYFQQCYSDNEKIQSTLITLYMKMEAYDKAIEICNNHSGHVVFDSQYVKILINLGKFQEAIMICEKYPDDKDFYRKLRHIRSLMSAQNVLFDLETKNILSEIREKLSNNDFANEDFLLITDLEGHIDDAIYKFMLVAAYHRRKMFNSALQVLKSIDNPEYKKLKNRVIALINNKKMSNFYDMGLYDEIIGWGKVNQNESELKVAKVKNAKIIG